MNTTLKLLASECGSPVRAFLIDSAGLFLVALLVHWYTRRTEDRKEQLKRFKMLFLALISLTGAVYCHFFTSICAVRASCKDDTDLNCTGATPRMFAIGVVVLVAVAAGSVLAEVVRRRRA